MTVTFGHAGATAKLSPKALAGGAAIIGGSMWSTHYTAMLAVKFPVAISYSAKETLLSLCVAIFFTGVALAMANVKPLGVLRVPLAAAIMGSGMGALHYLGMGAMSGCGLVYDFSIVGVSLGVAIVMSGVALWLAFRKRGAAETFLAGVCIGLAVGGMHFTGMYATSFYPAAIEFDTGALLLSQRTLALSVAAATLVICGYYLFMFSSMLTHEEV